MGAKARTGVDIKAVSGVQVLSSVSLLGSKPQDGIQNSPIYTQGSSNAKSKRPSMGQVQEPKLTISSLYQKTDSEARCVQLFSVPWEGVLLVA